MGKWLPELTVAVAFVAFVAFALGVALGAYRGEQKGRELERAAAAAAGAGRYAVDPKSGEARFEYGRATP